MNTYENVSLSWERPEPPAAKPVPQLDKGVADRLMAHLFSPGGMIAGSGAAAWSSDRYQQVLRYVSWNYIAINSICKEMAGLTPQVGFRLDPDLARERKRFGRKMLDRVLRQKAIVSAQESEEIEPAPFDHRLVKMLQNPNSPDVAWTFFFRWCLYLQLCGNSYIWVVPDAGLGLPIQMYVIPAHWVWAVAGENELVVGYEIRPFGGYGGARSAVIPARDMIHTALPGPLSIIDGQAPCQATALWNDVSQSMDVSQLSAFKKGIKMDLILALDPDYGEPDEPTMKRWVEKINRQYSGETNTGGVMIQPGGVTPHTVGRTVAEMDYLQSGDALRDKSLATYMVSKGFVGITEVMSRASLDASLAQVIRSVIKPILSLGGQVFTEHLAKRFDRRCMIYWPDPTPLDPMQRNADLLLRFQTLSISPNEIRKEFGAEAWPHGGDDPVSPTGMVTSIPWGSGQSVFEPVGFVDPSGVEEPLGADDLDGPLNELGDLDADVVQGPQPPVNRVFKPSLNGHSTVAKRL